MTAGVVEHPDCPPEPFMPSIWRLRISRMLARHPQCHQFSFHQGPLGQASPKPTRFHTCYAPTLLARIQAFSTLRNRGAASQFDANGDFGTAKLKTYPPRLCGSILLGFLDSFANATAASCDPQLVTDFLGNSERVILARCDDVQRLQDLDSSSVVDFQDQDLVSATSGDAELSAFASWPDRGATMGRDFAF